MTFFNVSTAPRATLGWVQRRYERLFNRPFFKTASQESMGHIKQRGPIHQTHRTPLECDVVISTMVTILFGVSAPLAILRRVAKIVIATLNAVLSRWSSPHVLQKISKRMFPAFANRNTPTAIPSIFAIIRIASSLVHFNPYAILRDGRESILRHPMNGQLLAPKTSARLSVATFSLMGRNVYSRAAVADTFPPAQHRSIFTRFEGFCFNHKSPIALTDVFLSEWLRRFGEFRFTHDGIIA